MSSSSIIDISNNVDNQEAKAIEEANSLASWHELTPGCSDGRITNFFDRLNGWVINNVRNSSGPVNRQTMVQDQIHNVATLSRLIAFCRAESILGKSKSIIITINIIRN